MESLTRRKNAEPSPPVAARLTPAAQAEAEPMFDLIELLFFAYRDFVSDADRLLENYGFGRAHHPRLAFCQPPPPASRSPNCSIF